MGTVVQSITSAAILGLAVLAPALRDKYGLTLGETGVMLGLTTLGWTVALIPWGLAVDRVGERMTSVIGLTGAAAGYVAAGFAPSFWALVLLLTLGGAFGACTSSATGRAVATWFGPAERGLALGIRQASIPVGALVGALCLPHAGPRVGLAVLGAGILLAAGLAAAFFREGARPAPEDHAEELLRRPLRDGRIWRLSIGSGLLVCTQVTMVSFVVLFFEDARGFSPAEAGVVLAGVNIVATAGRLLSGRLSDLRGSRLGLLRQIAVATSVFVAATAALVDAPAGLLVAAVVIGGGLSMSWNALSFAAAIELGGRARSGAALGLQQTMLGFAGSVTPILFAPFVEWTSWRAGFAVSAAVPVVALVVLRRLR